MYNEQIESLITAALADGVLTDKEKNLLFKKAEAMGIDRDEFELVLEGRLAKRKKEMEAQDPQATKPAKKEGAIPQELDDLIKEYGSYQFIKINYICSMFVAHLGKGNRKAEDLDIFRFLLFNEPTYI